MTIKDKTVVVVAIIDLIDTARELGMDLAALTGRPTPDHDYRFSIATPTGGEVTFSRGATADHVARYCAREGWIS